MRTVRCGSWLVLLLAGIAATGLRAGAQGFGLSITTSTRLVHTYDTLTNTIHLTNQTGGALSDVLVTNIFPPSAPWILARIIQGPPGIVTNTATAVIFDLGTMSNGASAQLIVVEEPTVPGFITNSYFVASDTVTNTVSTNVVVQAITAQGDLGVAVTGPAQSVFVHDYVAYGVTITNGGPEDVPDVGLTNRFSTAVDLIGVAPPHQSYTITNGTLILNAGTLTNGASKTYQLTVAPSASGPLDFGAALGTPGLQDPNPTNNVAGTNLFVFNFLSHPGDLDVTLLSTQHFNLQSGLLEQRVRLSNAGSNAFASTRVMVSGLTTVQLANAVATNAGNPYVVYAAPLAAGQSEDLLLQFQATNYFALSNAQLSAAGVTAYTLTPPAPTALSTNLNFIHIARLANGNVLMEWPSASNRTYTVVYSDNARFSNAKVALPSVRASANYTQWIDYGPPGTVSSPTNSAARFYRVFRDPIAQP